MMKDDRSSRMSSSGDPKRPDPTPDPPPEAPPPTPKEPEGDALEFIEQPAGN